MGNGYNQHHQQQLYHHILHGSSGFFLPMLCKLSIKDVKLQNSKNPSSSANLSADNHNEPTSPKVSCMGQVKRNNRVIGFPTPYRPTSTTAITGPVNSKVKYLKLKKLFSGKNFTPGTNTGGIRKSTKVNDTSKINVVEVNVSELDPPLPVVKKVNPAQAADGGLWKRRSGGTALKSLQIQQIHLPIDNSLLQPTTV
ncbi:uncharacterized protein LOC129903155 [Solanum dulcamara]|uniref:uncharacterized protein LOC129903155 n=1 Tax=Solanum dulcamara TaxID=45834 RepID=UPI00248554D2|nr:uncharacterized protein LOC129903155 [Solanum dulcamara]